MGRGKKYQPEQVVCQIEVAVSNGKTAPQACKEAGIVELHPRSLRMSAKLPLMVPRQPSSVYNFEPTEACLSGFCERTRL